MKKTAMRKRKSTPTRHSSFLNDLDKALHKYLSALKTAKTNNLATVPVRTKKNERTN